MRKRKIPEKPVYFMMNKKKGSVCSAVSSRRKTIFEDFVENTGSSLEEFSDGGVKLHSVGRLDAESEGLILLTNDGLFSNYLTRPENHIQKKYIAVLEKDISPLEKKEFSKRAENGVFLPPEKKFGEQFCSSIILDWDFSSELIKKYSVPVKKNNSSCLITLEEGKFHEIRRLFAIFENSVIFLKRISAANVFLDEKLLPGHCRTLLKEELDIINQHFF